MKLQSKILPSLGPVAMMPYMPFGAFRTYLDRSIYKSKEFYPSSHYTYRIGCGLNKKGQHVTFVVIHIYPVRYSPMLDKIEMAGKAEIKISYMPGKTLPEKSQYDLLIITPQQFNSQALRLAEHKNRHGVETIVKTTDEIYSSYSGRDEAEKIKYAIKDAIEKYGIKYVLLFGGLKSKIYGKARDNPNAGIEGWYVPVRYSNLKAEEPG